ncbi:TPA: hypothetical protein NH763_003105 [Pseudomonas aeruginosa]|nr:hypothetical protein [Pseudomonas aeruginosa]
MKSADFAKSGSLFQSFHKEYLGFDEDGFKIVTMAGNVITPTEIRVSDSYHVKVFGKSIDKSDTFDKLKGYYDRLKSSGVLAQ